MKYLPRHLLISLLFLISLSYAQTYKNYDELTSALKNITRNNSSIINLESIGKTGENRDLWMVTLATKNETKPEERPALLITANIEAAHLAGSEFALSAISYFVNNYKTNDRVKKALDNYTIYIIPRLNPDGTERAFMKVKTGQRTNLTPFDSDNDGRIDEDGFDDIDNDGKISFIRVKDESGLYTTDSKDSRILKKADPAKGERGEYSVYFEGIDNDGDGFYNEDPQGGIDLNRNFQHEYPYYTPDAGIHMVCETESRAVIDWMIGHRNIAILLTYGLSDNLITPPNDKGKLSSDRELDLLKFAELSALEAIKKGFVEKKKKFNRDEDFYFGQPESQIPVRPDRAPAPATDINNGDLEYFKTVAEQYKKLTGIEKQPAVRTPKGALFQYGYFQYGILSLSTPGWGLTSEKPEKPVGDAKTLKENLSFDHELLNWLDKNNSTGFINWKPVKHPTLGEVETGGFDLYSVFNPPAKNLEQAGEKHSEFALYLTSLFPEVRIAKTEIKNNGGGLFTVKAEIINKGFLPTALEHSVVSKSVKPVMVQIGIKPEQIISGNQKTTFIKKLDGSGKREKFEWLIKAESGDKIELKVVSQKGGNDKTILIMK